MILGAATRPLRISLKACAPSERGGGGGGGRASVQSSGPRRPSKHGRARVSKILRGVSVGADESDFLKRHTPDVETALRTTQADMEDYATGAGQRQYSPGSPHNQRHRRPVGYLSAARSLWRSRRHPSGRRPALHSVQTALPPQRPSPARPVRRPGRLRLRRSHGRVFHRPDATPRVPGVRHAE